MASPPNPDRELDRLGKVLAEGLPSVVVIQGPSDFFRQQAVDAALEKVPEDVSLRRLEGDKETDGRELDDSPRTGAFASDAIVDWVEDVMGLNDYDHTNLHTSGIRLNGAWNGLDYDAEFAYQFGTADRAGFYFRPVQTAAGLLGPNGDDEARFSALATDIEIGYNEFA